MLGKLARYLRIMGYDTVYQSYYPDKKLNNLVMEGRILITKNQKTARAYSHSIFIDSDCVKNQLRYIDNRLGLKLDPKRWLSRCLLCNSTLMKAESESARKNVPDFVFSNYLEQIFYCQSCKKFYWPGTHRDNMLERLRDWGLKSL